METLTTELIDEGARHDRRGRRLMPAEQVAALLQDYEGSGLTQAEFARRAGVKYPTFAGWVRARRTSGPGRDGAVRFARVQLSMAGAAATGELSVVLPDGLVVRGTDATAMAALVRALRS